MPAYSHLLDEERDRIAVMPARALFDISAVFRELGPDKKVAALFVTVDPERDTPDVLKT